MAQDRWWIHQRGKSLYSTQTLLKKMCMAKTCKKMSIYDDIWWYMSIYVNMVQDWTYNKFHSTAWKCIICSNPCTGTIWNIKEPLTPSSNSPFWGEGRWLYGRSWRCAHSKTKVPAGAEANACPTSVAPAISSANESASDLPRFACCYTIICITRSLTQQLTQQYQTVTKLGGNTSTSAVPRTTRSLMKHSCNLSKARTLAVEHAIPGRQGSGQKTATGKKSENQRTSEHLNTFDRFWQRVDASNRITSSGTNIQSNSR